MNCPAGTAAATDLDRAADPVMFRMFPRLLLSVVLSHWIENYLNRIVEYQAAAVPVGCPSELVQPKAFLRQ